MATGSYHDLRCRKQWIVAAPDLLLPQIIAPVDDHLQNVVADGEEPRRECFGELGVHLARVLDDSPLIEIDVFELDRCGSSVAGTRQDREGDEGSIAALKLGVRRHHTNE